MHHELREARQSPNFAWNRLTAATVVGKSPERRSWSGLAPLAQLDRAPDFESGGRRFESCGARKRRKVGETGVGSAWRRWGEVTANVWGHSQDVDGRPPVLPMCSKRSLRGAGTVVDYLTRRDSAPKFGVIGKRLGTLGLCHLCDPR